MYDTHNRIIYFFIYLLIYVFEYFRQPREQRLQLDSLAGPHPPTLPACLHSSPAGMLFSLGWGGGVSPHMERAMRGMWRLKPPPNPNITTATTRHRLHFEQQYISAFSSLCSHTQTRAHAHTHTLADEQAHTGHRG